MSHVSLERTRPDDYLLRLAATDVGRAAKDLAADELRIEEGDLVLDVGCGPGADLARYAARVGASGRVVGIDQDVAAVDEARARCADDPRIDVIVGDAQEIDIADGSVDRLHTDRVLQHVSDPAAALREAFRVLRPGGRAVFAEPDWDTLVVDHDDLAVVRAYRQHIVDDVVRNACIGRQFPGLATVAGLQVEGALAVTATFLDPAAADRMFGFARVTGRAVDAGVLTEADASAWLDRVARRPFFASVTLFVVVAER